MLTHMGWGGGGGMDLVKCDHFKYNIHPKIYAVIMGMNGSVSLLQSCSSHWSMGPIVFSGNNFKKHP